MFVADGASHDPCDDLLYCGDSVASERETRGIQNEMADLIARYDNVLGFIDIHTFGNNILMPYRFVLLGCIVCIEFTGKMGQ